MLKKLLRSAAVQAVTARAVSLYLGFALRSTRWTVVGDVQAAVPLAGTPVLGVFWHEFLPLIPAWLLYARPRGGALATPYVLISKHRDGRFIAAVVKRFGIHVVHGSSSKNKSARDVSDKGGVAGVRALLRVLQAANYAMVTPDGPRGPARRAALGVAQLAALSGVPVTPAAAQTTHRWRLPTWDRTIVPLPFGRGVIVVGAPVPVPRDGWAASLPVIEAALNAVAEEAERLCSR